MTTEEIEARRADLIAWRIKLIGDIEAITTKLTGNGPPEVHDRLAAALARKKSEMKRLNVAVTEIDRRLGQERKRRHIENFAARHAVRDRLFVEAARRMLPRETFLDLWSLADTLEIAPAQEAAS